MTRHSSKYYICLSGMGTGSSTSKNTTNELKELILEMRVKWQPNSKCESVFQKFTYHIIQLILFLTSLTLSSETA